MACLQAQVMQVKAQLAQNMIDSSRNMENNQWQGNLYGSIPNINCYSSSSQSSVESMDANSDGVISMQDVHCSREEIAAFQSYSKKRPFFSNSAAATTTDLGELQALALRMMRN